MTNAQFRKARDLIAAVTPSADDLVSKLSGIPLQQVRNMRKEMGL